MEELAMGVTVKGSWAGEGCCNTKNLVRHKREGPHGRRHELPSHPRTGSSARSPASPICYPETLGQESPLRPPVGNRRGPRLLGGAGKGKQRTPGKRARDLL